MSRGPATAVLVAVLLLLADCAAGQQAVADEAPATSTQQAQAAVRALQRWAARRRPCAPNDARCIGLRDHICDPYFVNVTDKCTFVQYNRHCAEDVHHIDYLPLFYCTEGDGHVLVALGFLAWMGVLFWVMSKVAEDFLVPALEHLAEWMRLAPDVAGVTLFAFASGAPDLFTQIAAVAGGGRVDQELAISATLGGGLFIIAVIFAVVTLVPRDSDAASTSDGEAAAVPPEITDRRAFVRDAVAYMLSTLALLWLMLRGTFSAAEAALMLLGYGAYLVTCLLTSKGGAGHRHAYLSVAPSQQQMGEAQQGGVDAAQQQQQGQQLWGVGEGSPLGTPRLQQIELASRPAGPSGPQLQRKSSASSGMVSSPMRSKLAGSAASLGNGSMLSRDNAELAGLVAGLPPSEVSALAPAGPPPRSPPAGALRAKARGSGSRMVAVLHSALLGLEELLHTHGKSGPRLWLTILMAPALLLLHLTMPALHRGHYTPWYAALLAVGAPLFTLLSTELYPERLTTPQFLLAWLLSAAALLVAQLLLVRPASSTRSGGGGGSASRHGSVTAPVSVDVVATAAGSPLAAAAGSGSARWWGRAWPFPAGSAGGCMQLCLARRPRRNVLLAVLAAVQCMLWMSMAADELVALFQAIGRICDISQDLLGATVLAWGEAVPELVATMSLARQGQATMAIAAVFGGPIFNVLVAWAGPTLYAAVRHGPMAYQLSAGVSILVAFTVLILAVMLAVYPLLCGWRLDRRAAAVLLLLFGLAQLLFLLKELL